MTREELIGICRKAKDVGQVRHEDFVEFVRVLESRKKVGDEWQVVEHAYMGVDGKLAMANDDHRKQGKRLDVDPPAILADGDDEVTLLVVVTSEIYGKRCGIATSHKKGNSPAERSNPWEVAETSAIGRALSGYGYGLLPGAGLASAEDIARAGAARAPRAAATRPGGAPVTTPATNGSGTINSPAMLLAAVAKVTPYYNAANQTEAFLHLQGGIRKQNGNSAWKWPTASQTEAWKEACGAAVEYAKAQEALCAAGKAV